MYNRLNNKNLGDETSTDESKTETSMLSSTAISADSYGSTSVEDEPVPQCYVPWCGLVFYVMGFFGFSCALLVRTGLSVAIVAMVNQTAVSCDVAMTNASEDQCPRDPELRYEDGEFIWDRHQQGVVLAAFYYGYGVLQVYIMNILRAATVGQISKCPRWPYGIIKGPELRDRPSKLPSNPLTSDQLCP